MFNSQFLRTSYLSLIAVTCSSLNCTTPTRSVRPVWFEEENWPTSVTVAWSRKDEPNRAEELSADGAGWYVLHPDGFSWIIGAAPQNVSRLVAGWSPANPDQPGRVSQYSFTASPVGWRLQVHTRGRWQEGTLEYYNPREMIGSFFLCTELIEAEVPPMPRMKEGSELWGSPPSR